MSELRIKQRKRRETAIIEAAKQLVNERGYYNTSVEDIARKAEVGPATVYNYFGSKFGIFISVLYEYMKIMRDKGEKIITNPPDSAEEGVFELVKAFYSDLSRLYGKKLIREVYSAGLVEHRSNKDETPEQTGGTDNIAITQIAELIQLYQTRKQITSDLDVTEATYVLYSLISSDLILFLSREDMTVEVFLNMVKRHLSILFKGLAP